MNQQNNEEKKLIKPGSVLTICKYHLDTLPNKFRDLICSELDMSYPTYYRRINQGYLIDISSDPNNRLKPPFSKVEDKAIADLFKNFTDELRVFAEFTDQRNIE